MIVSTINNNLGVRLFLLKKQSSYVRIAMLYEIFKFKKRG